MQRSIAGWYLVTEERPAAAIAADLELLDETERARRDALAFAADRLEFATAHALLRRSLSCGRNVAPGAWQFEAGEFGKPFVRPERCAQAPAFSVSHTRGLVGCVVADAGELGIDVEPLERPRNRLEDLAQRFFAPREVSDLRALPDAERRIRFTELWVLKEAYIKAIGRGLSHPLRSFAFEFVGSRRLRFSADDDSPARWQFGLFAAADRYRLAIASAADPTLSISVCDAAHPTRQAVLLRST